MNTKIENRSRSVISMVAMLTLAVLFGTALVAADVDVRLPDGKTSAGQDAPLSFLTNLLFWELVAFVLLLLVLSKIVFPPMFGAMKRRQERIETALSKAERVNEEAEKLLKKHEKMMAEAHAEAKKITDEAQAAAARIQSEAAEKAKKDAAEIVGRARNEIRMAQSKAIADLRHSAVELSLLASSAVLKRAVTGEDQKRLAGEAINAAAQSLSSRN